MRPQRVRGHVQAAGDGCFFGLAENTLDDLAFAPRQTQPGTQKIEGLLVQEPREHGTRWFSHWCTSIAAEKTGLSEKPADATS